MYMCLTKASFTKYLNKVFGNWRNQEKKHFWLLFKRYELRVIWDENSFLFKDMEIYEDDVTEMITWMTHGDSELKKTGVRDLTFQQGLQRRQDTRREMMTSY